MAEGSSYSAPQEVSEALGPASGGQSPFRTVPDVVECSVSQIMGVVGTTLAGALVTHIPCLLTLHTWKCYSGLTTGCFGQASSDDIPHQGSCKGGVGGMLSGLPALVWCKCQVLVYTHILSSHFCTAFKCYSCFCISICSHVASKSIYIQS